MPKPTYADIACLARVGTATVERVLNGRGGVRPVTVEKVVLAAKKLDWPGRLPKRHLGIVRIEVILVRPDTTFYRRLAEAFRRIALSLDSAIHIQLVFLQENNSQAIARRILNPPVHRSGLIAVVPSYVEVTAALTRVGAEGLPVIQMVSGSATGLEFVGIDNIAAGRMAALMMAGLGRVKGTVVAMCHSQVYAAHRERIRGFSDYLLENSDAELQFAFVIFGHDEMKASARCVLTALERWPDLAGIYNAGGGNSGVMDVLRQLRRKIFFVGHELTDYTRTALKDGVADVIFDQVPEEQARRAVDLVLAGIGLFGETVENPPIQFTTLTAENI